MSKQGNKNGCKPEEEKATEWLQVRVRAEDKDAWKKKAKEEGLTLSQFTIRHLNRQSLVK